ncbi:MAG: hypothetical protein UV79_C0011G0013 [candidate division TM6 bacterium GW2011_GWF2_43_17]|nr:MAG: hypothetical protein UV79_C0011G0013 [candidate division TM6 bacterium GW2011_GWF2_43_17]HAU30520.1 hypothetical protein [Candidatus Dependentiae bacterium]
MKNSLRFTQFFFAATLFPFHTTADEILPSSCTSARAFPGIVRFEHPNLTTGKATIGAYLPSSKASPYPATVFFQATGQQNITAHIFLSTTLLAPGQSNTRTPFVFQDISSSYLIGYTNSYQGTKKLDFINTSICSGLAILPESRKNKLSFPVGVALELGLFDWLNLGIREDLFFGFGKDLPTQNNLLFYGYADQPIKGLCAHLGLSITQQVSSQALFTWDLFTLHIGCSLDLASTAEPHMPMINLFCDYALGCKAAAQASSRVGIAISTSF